MSAPSYSACWRARRSACPSLYVSSFPSPHHSPSLPSLPPSFLPSPSPPRDLSPSLPIPLSIHARTRLNVGIVQLYVIRTLAASMERLQREQDGEDGGSQAVVLAKILLQYKMCRELIRQCFI